MASDGKVTIDTALNNAGLEKGLGSLKKFIAGLGISKVVAEAVKSFAEFDTGIAKASTLFGDVNVNTAELSSKMLDLSSATGETSATLNEGLYTALSAGVPVTDDMTTAMGFMTSATKLAKAGFTDVDTAVGATAKVLNAYHMDMSEIDTVSNVLMATQNKGITTVGELSQSLAQVTPIASASSISLNDVGASLATMTKQGVPTTQATTQLKQVISELGKSGTTASTNLKKMAESTGMTETSLSEMMDSGMSLNDVLDAMNTYAQKNDLSITDMFSSIDAGQGALELSGDNSAMFVENLNAMENSAGLVDDAYETMSSDLTTQMDRVKVSLTNLGNIMLGKILPSLTPVLSNLTTMVNKLDGNYDASNDLTSSLKDLKTANANYNRVLDESAGKTDDLTVAMVAQAKTAREIAIIDLAKTYSESQKGITGYEKDVVSLQKNIDAQNKVMEKYAYNTMFTTEQLNSMGTEERNNALSTGLSSREIAKYNMALGIRTLASKDMLEASGKISQSEQNERDLISSLTQSYIKHDEGVELLLNAYPQLKQKVLDNVDAFNQQQQANEDEISTAKYGYEVSQKRTDLTAELSAKLVTLTGNMAKSAKTEEAKAWWTKAQTAYQGFLTDAIEETTGAEKQSADEVKNIATAHDTLQDTLNANTKKEKLLGDAFDKNSADASAYNTYLEALIDNHSKDTKEIQDTVNAYISLTTTTTDYFEAINNGNSILSVLKSRLSNIDTLQNLLGDSFDSSTAKAKAYKEAFVLLGTQIDLTGVSYDDFVKKFSEDDSTSDKLKDLTDFSGALGESLYTALGVSVEEAENLESALDSTGNMFGKLKVLATASSDVIASAMINTFDDIQTAIGEVIAGSNTWADVMDSVAKSIEASLADVLIEMAKQLTILAVVKAIKGDWVGAGIAVGGAILAGASGSVLDSIASKTSDEGTSTSATTEETPAEKAEANATSLKTKISDLEAEQATLKGLINDSTQSSSDRAWYASQYNDNADDLTEYRRQLSVAEHFSTGGVVGGGATTGDKIMSYLNSGEVVLNAQQQMRLLGRLGKSSQTVQNINNYNISINGDTYGVDNLVDKVYNGIKQREYEGAY